MTSEDQVARLKALLGRHEATAVRMFIARGSLRDGQQLTDLTPPLVSRALHQYDSLMRSLREFMAPEELEAEAKIQRAKRDQKRLDYFNEKLPESLAGMRAELAPMRPQFEFVSTWFSSECSPFFDDDASSEKTGLILFGPSGSGKTVAAWALARDAIISIEAREFEFVRSVTFFRVAKTKHLGNDRLSEFNAMFERAGATDLLILDDVGTEASTDNCAAIFFELLDQRTEDRKFTCITSNYETVQDLASAFGSKLQEKIARRIRQFFWTVDFNKE